MTKQRRSFSAAEKLQILNEADQYGTPNPYANTIFRILYFVDGRNISMKEVFPIFNHIHDIEILKWKLWKSKFVY